MSSVIQETHQIAAGSDFDGTVPAAGSEDLKSGDLIYSPATAGGLFKCPTSRDDTTREINDPETSDRAREVKRISVTFGGQTSWSLSIVNADDEEVLLLSGNIDSSLVITDIIMLSPGDKLKLVTTGASTAMIAIVTYNIKQKV